MRMKDTIIAIGAVAVIWAGLLLANKALTLLLQWAARELTQ